MTHRLRGIEIIESQWALCTMEIPNNAVEIFDNCNGSMI